MALAPIEKTDMHHRRTRGGKTRVECWGAITTDGIWAIHREESAGTPWWVIHRETQTWVNLLSTLPDCQMYIARGDADADLGRLQAHDRGEHKATRDPWCGRC